MDTIKRIERFVTEEQDLGLWIAFAVAVVGAAFILNSI